jgi:4a-hydroxytetrahydrobiopterin dehydratase
MSVATPNTLLEKNCRPLKDALTQAQITILLPAVDGWQQEQQQLCKTYRFKDYYETLAFINAIAYTIHAQDHHPDLLVTYQHCTVRFHTHSVNEGKGGISENDFICAAKIDAIFQQTFCAARAC